MIIAIRHSGDLSFIETAHTFQYRTGFIAKEKKYEQSTYAYDQGHKIRSTQ